MRCTLRAKRHLISTAIVAGTLTAAILLPTGTSFASPVEKHDSPGYIASNSGDADDSNSSAFTFQNFTGTDPASSPNFVYFYSNNNGQYAVDPNTGALIWFDSAGTSASSQQSVSTNTDPSVSADADDSTSADADDSISGSTDQYVSSDTDQYTAGDSALTADTDGD